MAPFVSTVISVPGAATVVLFEFADPRQRTAMFQHDGA
jgi:hypothetical protein